MKKKKLRRIPLNRLEVLAISNMRPHPYVNEVWATLDCWHPCFFRFYGADRRVAMLRCCECEYVYYPSSMRGDSVYFAIGGAL